MAELTPDDPGAAETIEQYVGLLGDLCRHSGLSLRRLERRARALALPRWLPSSTVSDVFRNPGRLVAMTDRREFVASILRCCDVTEAGPWLAALDRLVLEKHAPGGSDETTSPVATSTDDKGADTSTDVERAGAAVRPLLPIIGAVVACAVSAGVVWFALGRSQRRPPPSSAPAGSTCAADAAADATIDASELRGRDAKRENPTLDFAYLHGSAWYAYHNGATYYWGRGRSDAGTGGVRLDWRVGTGPWHSCPAIITGHSPTRDYVRTPAVKKVVGGVDLVMRICLWADYPRYTEKCTGEL
ncbi:hypothetical protein GCM10023196_041630 [Actinoallomurus vinaceus]|uniref:XRE family transcriptional regulator n=1 Tax=Actinoallomurus vinaceus TaxID=1080074 RepID=A0ABP8UAN1_9ACTN